MYSEVTPKYIFQLKITLNDIDPPIWRRIQVPDSHTFWDLHVAIQDAMGWSDTHLHEFLVTDPASGVPVRIGVAESNHHPSSGGDVPVARYLRLERPRATYIYDFGDHWRHTILLESVLPRDQELKYPHCLAGERACPPEDCGGPPGYGDLLEAIGDPKHEEHEASIDRVDRGFDPEVFDIAKVNFDDPKERWKERFR